MALEERDGDDAVLDSVGSGSAEKDSTAQFGKDGNHNSLLHSEGARTDGGGEGVCDIVGTDTEGIAESDDQSGDEKPCPSVGFHCVNGRKKSVWRERCGAAGSGYG